jgi:hypothetical protein
MGTGSVLFPTVPDQNAVLNIYAILFFERRAMSAREYDAARMASNGLSDDEATLPIALDGAEIDQFLEQIKSPAPRSSAGSARLIVGIDATASREAMWDQACQIQGEMFEATSTIGGLEIQLSFYRGFNECKSSRWVTTASALHQLMRSVNCVGGRTQIGRILDHAIRETQRHRIGALVFVGDAMEEDVDKLCHLAGELGRLGVPIFMFHEGRDPIAASAFKQIASLSGGAYAVFDSASAERLKILLGAVAVYAAGGYAALEDYGRKQGGEVLRLTHQMEGHRQ